LILFLLHGSCGRKCVTCLLHRRSFYLSISITQHKPTKCTLFELIFQLSFSGLDFFYMFRTSWVHLQEDSCKDQ